MAWPESFLQGKFMSIYYRAFAHLFVVLLFVSVSVGNVCAEPVTWTLSGVTFADGGTASGSFVYDADNPVPYVVLNWSISVAGGDTATFPTLTYDQSNSSGYYANNNPTATGASFSLNGSTRQIRLPGTSALTDAGGTIPVNILGAGAAECFNCGPYRKYTAGNLIGTVPPAVTSAASTSFSFNTAGSFTITATGVPVPAIAVTGTLPTGVTYVDNGNGTGTLAGTPTSAGSYPLSVTASNLPGPNGSQSFILTVNQPPAITSAGAATFTAGSAGSFTVTTSGFPAPGITATGALPAGVSFVDNGDGTGTFSGTPGPNAGGIYAVLVTASNGSGTDATQNFSLTVNQAPQITSAALATFVVGNHGAFTITSTAYPVSALSLVGALPAGVTFVDNGNGTATLAGTPGANTAGSYVLSIGADNGIGTATQSFILSVVNPIQIPTLGDFGLVIFALLLVCAGLAYRRQHDLTERVTD